MSREENLIKYYNKFTEDKRLKSRHGIVEQRVALYYINKYVTLNEMCSVLDVGAGTGAYSEKLALAGAKVAAVEPVKYNLGILKAKNIPGVKAYLGDARDLSKFKDETFDVVLLFGPMYHLFGYDNKLKALIEAKRVVKKGGYIFISYLMNDYAVITHAFKCHNILKAKQEMHLTEDYKIIEREDDLYSYLRLEDINKLMEESGLKRVQIIGQDGASDYIRNTLNSMTEEEFEEFVNYTIKISERPELIGASSHVLDILIKE